MATLPLKPPGTLIRYKRKGRRKCGAGIIISTGALGTFKVGPTHAGWRSIIVTQAEVDAANPALHRIAALRHAPGWESTAALQLLHHFCNALEKMERRLA